jgi:hypothetical protein
MCDKCDQFDKAVVRLYQLKQRLSDQRMNDAVDRVIAEFQSQKPARHPQGTLFGCTKDQADGAVSEIRI